MPERPGSNPRPRSQIVIPDGGSLRRGFLAMTIAKGATATKTPENRIGEQTDRIVEIVERHFRRMGIRVVYHLGESVPLGERFQDSYGEWAAAGFCVEIYVGR